jgi:hypothetical protein
VLSLIDGIAGITTVQVGNLVTQSTVLTAVSQVIYFRLEAPEDSSQIGFNPTGTVLF